MSKNNMNVCKFRSYFPVFEEKIKNYPLIYFDNASTAQVPREVVEAMSDYYLKYKANIGRGVYSFAEVSTQAYEDARKSVAEFIGAQDQSIVFTSGATDSINMVARSWAAYNLQAGDEIIVSAVEHHSNFLPWQELALQYGFRLKIAPVNQLGVLDHDQFKNMVTSATKLVAIVHTSNILGTTNDATMIIQESHKVGAKVLLDVSQSIAHQRINVEDLKCDFLAFSGHKLFGPTGVGVLYVAPWVTGQMRPSVFGGGMVISVQQDRSLYKPIPHGFEAGTPNIAGAIGLGAAIRFVLKNVNFDEFAQHETLLTNALIKGLRNFSDITLISIDPAGSGRSAHMVTFASAKYHAHDIAAYLDQYGIAVRAGHHCVQMYHNACHINASVRMSFTGYNTLEEVQFCLEKLAQLL